MSNRFIQFRQKAIDWLNSDRDFNAGITLLEESKFKPGVVAKLKRHGVNGPEATKRLKFLISELIKAWAMTDQEIVEDAPALEIETQPEHTDQNSLSLVDAYQVLESGEHQYPDTVSQLICRYADAYKQRDILHKKMADMPEDNEETTVAARKELSDQIAALSDEMEFLYPKYAAYSEKGVIPSEEDLILPSSDESKDTSKDAAEQDYSKMSKEELQKLRKSVATKIGRAKNMLEFQQESKADAPNPMPECPKRVKYQTKIDNLSEELKKIEYAIAALG
jgi:hypothetical protein